MKLVLCILPLVATACAGDQRPIGRCQVAPNTQPFVTTLPTGLMTQLLQESQPVLPEGFHWGTATAAFQVESNIAGSDWSTWEPIENDDRASDGPRHELHYPSDIARMQALGANSYRFSLEWSRLFDSKEALLADPPAANAQALLYYMGLVDSLVAAGIRPMITLQHFTLPAWLQGGVLAPDFVPLMARWAEWAAATFGDRVDYWITINEPSGLAGGGFIDGSFPPGRLVDLEGFGRAYAAMIEAHARMYDAIALADRQDADGDGMTTLISFATHNRLWLPVNPESEADVAGARRMRWLSHLALIEAASCGNYDANFDEHWDPKVDRVADASLRDRLDFIALNYYGTAGVVGFPLEPYLGLPQIDFPSSSRPKSDLGWDLAPEGLLPVLDELAGYRLPVIITENGLADAQDTLRPKFLVDSLAAVSAAVARGYDVRGYYHWSLIDNFEWAEGFCPRLGLYAVDYDDPARTRTARPSADVYRQIIAAGGVPAPLRGAYSYGPNSPCH